MEKAKWSGGLTVWETKETVYISVVFTWRLAEAVSIAQGARFLGKNVVVGGPALFLPQKKRMFDGIASVGKTYPDAIAHHNPMATIASRGCPVGCSFCIVPAMEGREFTLLPDFPVRPILCDNNLSALPVSYQKEIIRRYRAADCPLLDANSGFEPRTFTREIYDLWRDIINEGRGPWRFAYDDMQEREEVLRVMRMLSDEPQKRKRVYVLIGNEPFADCMQRVEEVIAAGCEPHCQPLMKLNADDRSPHVRFDWTERKLRDVARWANGFVWRKAPFSEYDRSLNRSRHRISAPGQSDLVLQ